MTMILAADPSLARGASTVIQAVSFASCYVYSPTGVGEVCERSRLLRAMLKAADAHFMFRYALRVHQESKKRSQLTGFFRATDLLVPVPGSRPKALDGSWVAADLAEALMREGLGCAAWPGLRRVCAVKKSGTAQPGERPSVAVHYESFVMQSLPFQPRSLVLVDDVITKGRTLLAAAARAREAFPGAQIRAFALLRTMGYAAGVGRLLEPCRGKIRWSDGDAHRSP